MSTAQSRFASIPCVVLAFTTVLVVFGLAGCAARTVSDPVTVLETPDAHPRQKLLAVEELSLDDDNGINAMRRVIWRPGFTREARELAVERLAERDIEALQRTIAQQLPRMTDVSWADRLAEIIVERGWIELTPALVNRWAAIPSFGEPETSRAEYQALVALHGEDEVANVVFDLFVETTRPSRRLFRFRCWELLHRIGERDRLVDLVLEADVSDDDPMLQDLRTVATSLDLVPWNGEEIRWARELLDPRFADYWTSIRDAVHHVPREIRTALEFRDLAVVNAAYVHEPDLLSMPRASLYDHVERAMADHRHHDRGMSTSRGRLHRHGEALTWGDLAAIRIALRAMDVPQVVAHWFDYADRDHADESTEYGGIVRLDTKNRFELLEFPPRLRQHDAKFIASQEMFDASYDALFHFHYHVQRRRNADYAGPGQGDRSYANSTRANCLVLTFISGDRLNVDFYRHDGVEVDLGEIRRPTS